MDEILTVIEETKILGQDVHLYQSIEEPLFEANEVARWLNIKNVSQMLKQAEIDETEKVIFLKYTLGGNQKTLFITEVQGQIVNELIDKNKQLQQFYDDLMNTEGLYHMNTVAKELKIGRNTLFAYLRGKEIMFYQDKVNVPYQRFMNQGLFQVIESPGYDGKYRPTTYATKKGLEYIRKLLRKDGYYITEVA